MPPKYVPRAYFENLGLNPGLHLFNIDSVISQDVPFWVTYQIITIVSLTVLTVKILENIIVDENLYFWYDCARNLYKVIAFQKPQTILKDMEKKLFIKLQLYFGHITLSRPPILNLVHSKCPTQVSHCPTQSVPLGCFRLLLISNYEGW